MNDRRGFTITELLIAMVVSLLVSLAGWTFYRAQLRTLTDQAAALEATEGARAAMGFLSREIRRAGLDPMASAFPTAGQKGISDAGPEHLLLQWDENSSGAVDPGATDPTAESVLYTYDSTNRRILRTVAGVTHPLIGGIPANGFFLEYLDKNEALLAPSGNPPALSASQRDAVTFVRLRIRVEAPTTQQPVLVELGGRATVRNRILGRL